MPSIDLALLERLDIEKAVIDEVAKSRNLLPPQLIDTVAKDHIADVAQIVDTRVRAGLVGTGVAPLLSARKVRHGRRPATALALPERVTYRAVTKLLEHGLAPARGTEDYILMDKAPIDAGCKFIIVTDLAHFYATIQIDQLARVLVSRTGEWSCVNWLSDFLRQTSGSNSGIPQGSFTSDQLADTLADTLLRNVRRRGFLAWQYSDDFRIGAADYQEAVRALEVFDEEARRLGLFINERKTFTYGADTYAESREQQIRFFNDSWSEKRKALTSVDLYSEEITEPTSDEVFISLAADELEAWAAQAADEHHESELMISARLDLSFVLQVLSNAKRSSALQHVPKLCRFEPHLTPSIAHYIRQMSAEFSFPADDAVADALKQTAFGQWQSAWMLYSVSSLERSAGEFESIFDTKLKKPVEEWAKRSVESDSEVVTAHAIWALAVNKTLDVDTWSKLSNGGDYNRPFAAAALAALPSKDVSALSTGDQLDVLMQRWAAEHL